MKRPKEGGFVGTPAHRTIQETREKRDTKIATDHWLLQRAAPMLCMVDLTTAAAEASGEGL